MQLFADTVEGRRRSVLFAIAIAAGVLCLAAASSVVVAGQSPLLATVFAVLGGTTLAFALLVYAGRFVGLTADEQVFWELSVRKRT